MSVHIKKREIIIKNGRNRTSRPKTFKTEAQAVAYAKEQGMKDVTVENLKSAEATTSKFRIVMNN
mgnify:CR=1 FL=1